MDFAQAIDNLKRRLAEARAQSLEGGFELAEAMLEQVSMEAERFRKDCIRQADQWEAQARAARFQADAYSAVAAMCYRIFNGFVQAGEKRLNEEKAAEAERLEKEAAAKPAEEEKPKKKRGDKPAE